MILALDFDGVIWDSVGECFVVARRTYQHLYGLPVADLERTFRSGRWLVNTGGDFLLVLQLASADPDGDLTTFPRERFEQLRVERKDEVETFAKEFYALREKLRDGHWAEWASYQHAYPNFLEQLKQVIPMFSELVVCTTKDTRSAAMLLESVGLKPEIWGREHGVDKHAQIEDLCRRRGVQGSDVVFLDDLIQNLDSVRPTGARCGLAAWGYNTPDERRRAAAAGYPVLDVFDVGRQLRAWAGEACSSASPMPG